MFITVPLNQRQSTTLLLSVMPELKQVDCAITVPIQFSMESQNQFSEKYPVS